MVKNITARGEGSWAGSVKKVKGLRSTRNSYGDVKFSPGNTVNYIVATVSGARWAFETTGGSLCSLFD